MGLFWRRSIEARPPTNYVGALKDMNFGDKLPIVYSDDYNISFGGLEKLHPFDAGKWGKIVQFLKDRGNLKDKDIIQPLEALEGDLLLVHSTSYLSSLKYSWQVAVITEVPFVALFPNFLVQRIVLRRFRLQTGGTIMAARSALDKGWAINVGGGFHHCSGTRGGGFCAYADISLAIKFLMKEMPERVKKAMVIDLDAHQGNGHERDFTGDHSVFILDVYNSCIYPGDYDAKAGISLDVQLSPYTEDSKYLNIVEKSVAEALEKFTPDIIVYNAGTDILENDPLGMLSISAKGIITRDEIVFTAARKKNIPIVMVTSGGYQRSTAQIIADSILNLREKNLVSLSSIEDNQTVDLQTSKNDGIISQEENAEK